MFVSGCVSCLSRPFDSPINRLDSYFGDCKSIRKSRALLLAAMLAVVTLLPALRLAAQPAYPGHWVGGGWSGSYTPYGVAADASGNAFVLSSNSVYFVPAGCTTASCVVEVTGFYSPGGITMDLSGNAYITDTDTSTNQGIVKEIPAGCTVSTCVFTLFAGGVLHEPLGLKADQSGNIWIADAGHDHVVELLAGCIPATCKYSTIDVSVMGITFPRDVAADKSGNVFVADAATNLLKEIPPGCIASSCVVTLSFGDPDAQLEGVAVDPLGNVYVADANADVVFELSGCSTSCSPGNFGGAFGAPSQVASDPYGNIFVSDFGPSPYRQGVREILRNGMNFGAVAVNSSKPITITVPFMFGGHTSADNVTTGVPTVLSQGVTGLDFTDAGTGTCTTSAPHTYYANDTCTVDITFNPRFPGARYGAVELVTADKSHSLVTTAYIYGTGTGPHVTFSPPSQNTSGGGFSAPQGVAVDENGNTFVADTANNAIKKIPAKCASQNCVLNVGAAFTFKSPQDVVVDGAGNLYFVDSLNQVRELPVQYGYYYYTMISRDGGFGSVYGLAVDASGNVYVADSTNNAVEEMPAWCSSSSCVVTLGGGFSQPRGVAVDTAGNVYVSDSGNGAVKEIPTGCTATNYANSICAVATLGGGFGHPAGVALDANGNLFVTDADNSSLKEIPSGCTSKTCVTTLSGSFKSPNGVAVDGSENVYVADYGSSTIQELDFSDPPSLTFAATDVGKTSSDSPQTVTVANDGNAALSFPSPGSGNNPAISAGFTLDSSGEACPLIAAGDAAGTLAAGASCTLSISFAPDNTSDTSGSLILTDTDLNLPGVTQTISLLGSLPKITPTIAWSPSAIAYGTSLAGVMNAVAINGKSVVPGSYAYFNGINPLTSTTVLPAGAYTLTVNFTPSDPNQYTTATTTASLTVNKAALTVTPDVKAMTYGGTLPALTGVITGEVSGDGITATYSTNATSKSDAGGAYLISATLNDPSGKLVNYTVTNNTAVFNVNKASLSITATGASMVYGATMSTFTGTYLGAVNGDTFTITGTTTATSTSPVGSYPITPHAAGAKLADYLVTPHNGALAITQATLTFTIANASRAYGAVNPAFTGKFTGLLNSDVITPTYGTTATATSKVGTYPITATLSGAKSVNYKSTVVPGTLTVSKATLNVTANGATRVYGSANPTFTAAITGFVNGDTPAKALTGSPTLATTATAKSPVASYPITPTAGTLAAANYTFKFVAGTLAVTKASLTVTAADASIPYNQAIPKFTYGASGYLNGDTASSLTGSPSETSTATKGSAVGTYTITITQGTLAATNYSFQFVNGTLTIASLGTAAAPVFHPTPGTSNAAVTVTLTDATSGAVFHYTANGTTPTTSSPQFPSAGLKVTATETLKVIAVAPGYNPSAPVSATYTIATAPTVTTTAATAIGTTKATLNGTVVANNATTQYWFAYGTSKTALTSTTAKTGSLTGTTSTAISATPTNLKSKTTYYFQAVGSNAEGTTSGTVLHFTTN